MSRPFGACLSGLLGVTLHYRSVLAFPFPRTLTSSALFLCVEASAVRAACAAMGGKRDHLRNPERLPGYRNVLPVLPASSTTFLPIRQNANHTLTSVRSGLCIMFQRTEMSHVCVCARDHGRSRADSSSLILARLDSSCLVSLLLSLRQNSITSCVHCTLSVLARLRPRMIEHCWSRNRHVLATRSASTTRLITRACRLKACVCDTFLVVAVGP